MLAWIKNYIYDTFYSGPARNAPCDGINIKKFIDEKPPDIKLISSNELLEAKNKLKPKSDEPVKSNSFFCITPKDLLKVKNNLHKTNKHDKLIQKNSPLLEEFNTVFKMGYKEFFEQRKLKM